MHFDHEKLDVYKAALDLVAFAECIVAAMPPGRATLADQLRRAAGSVPANIAEGAGEFTRRDKARFSRIARRSATECAAHIYVCMRLALTDAQKHQGCRALLLRIVSMLTGMVLALAGQRRSNRQPPKPSGTGTGAPASRAGTEQAR